MYVSYRLFVPPVYNSEKERLKLKDVETAPYKLKLKMNKEEGWESEESRIKEKI